MIFLSTLRIEMPGERINPVLTSNDHSHWQVKRKAAYATKERALLAVYGALNSTGFSADEFLTQNGRYFILDALPLKLVIRRYYSGHSQQMDRDNLVTSLKYHQDAVAKVLQIDDKHIKMEVYQARVKAEHSLSLEIIPAWALVGVNA